MSDEVTSTAGSDSDGDRSDTSLGHGHDVTDLDADPVYDYGSRQSIIAGWEEGAPEQPDPDDERPVYQGLQTGEQAPPSLTGFVKLKEFEKFYAYIHDKQAEVKRRFFDNGRLWERRWDFFYIYPPSFIQATPILLLPLPQAEHFVRTINTHLRTNFAIPSQADEPGLIMESPDNGTPRPRYIAWAADPCDVPSIRLAAPARSYLPVAERRDDYNGYKEPTEEGMLHFHAQMEALAESERRKRDNDKLKKEKIRHQVQRAKGHELMRAQRYLGLRERKINGSLRKSESVASKLNLDKPAPYQKESSVVFICIDIEAYEFPPNPITEIGVATLDTADIAGLAPGKNGQNWFAKIRARHFLIEEFRHLENRTHCQGNRDGFVFGATERIPLAQAKGKILSCFRPPFSQGYGKPDEDDVTLVETEDTETERNIVFVGHDAKQDIDYLKRLDVVLERDVSRIKDIIDSSGLYQALRRDPSKASLGTTLLNTGLVGYNLHNGGNDAVFTIQAMIAIALKAELEKDTLEEQHEAEFEKRIKAAVDHQTQILRKQKEGWDVGEDSDGGEPGNPFDQFKPKAPSKKQPKSKITDPVRGPWTRDLAQALPSFTFSPAQQRREDVMSLSMWRPGINEMRDEDIDTLQPE